MGSTKGGLENGDSDQWNCIPFISVHASDATSDVNIPPLCHLSDVACEQRGTRTRESSFRIGRTRATTSAIDIAMSCDLDLMLTPPPSSRMQHGGWLRCRISNQTRLCGTQRVPH
ncbi:hypothetical protein Hypma_014734 [Hypsizygus marmoreus]|uniref:Uncharacterized protein n=1 Tax=Hypsizygus marmoreus TaxID=39966 RepID=A0A369J9A7_HYPMA|nr:hypothetical protein Hypma_014734 [Hypsizygus marmoreus]